MRILDERINYLSMHRRKRTRTDSRRVCMHSKPCYTIIPSFSNSVVCFVPARGKQSANVEYSIPSILVGRQIIIRLLARGFIRSYLSTDDGFDSNPFLRDRLTIPKRTIGSSFGHSCRSWFIHSFIQYSINYF